MNIAQVISEYGFPVVATVGLLYMIYFIWGYITKEIKLKLGETTTTLIGLIDRIRMLDNDIIRLQQKLDTVIEIREIQDKKILKAATSIVGHVVVIFCVALVCCILLLFSPLNTASAEMLHKFKSPSFSGNGMSAHYLTIENQEHSRENTIKEEKLALVEEAEREVNNSTLARFIRNLESRIYAELSRQLVDNMFGETKSESGSFELEGNKVDYSTNGQTVSLTVTDQSGGTTIISVPVGDFYF